MSGREERTSAPTILPFGDRGAMREVATLDEALALHAAASASVPSVVIDLVPAARTLLAVTEPGGTAAAARWLASLGVTPRPWQPGTEHAIAVVYDGPDLADVAAATGRSPGEVVEWHRATRWRAAFTGFAPGFAYLVPVDAPALDVPRLDAPRPSVAAGSVALAAGYSAVYPTDSPGGWRIIGSTSVDMRALDIRAGDAVRFTESACG